MAPLDFLQTQSHLQAWLGEPVAISAGADTSSGPLDVLSVQGTLAVGWDLQLANDADGAVFFSLEGDQGSGLMLEQSAFERATGDAEQLIIWSDGTRVTIDSWTSAEVTDRKAIAAARRTVVRTGAGNVQIARFLSSATVVWRRHDRAGHHAEIAWRPTRETLEHVLVTDANGKPEAFRVHAT